MNLDLSIKGMVIKNDQRVKPREKQRPCAMKVVNEQRERQEPPSQEDEMKLCREEVRRGQILGST